MDLHQSPTLAIYQATAQQQCFCRYVPHQNKRYRASSQCHGITVRFAHFREMTQIIDENSKTYAQESSAPPHSTAVSVLVFPRPRAVDQPPLSSSHGKCGPAGPATGPDRTRPRLCRGRQFRQHAKSLRLRLEALCRLVPAPKPLSPPPDPEIVGLYITACASGSAVGMATRGGKPNTVSTIERRLAAIGWNCAQRGTPHCPGRRKRSS